LSSQPIDLSEIHARLLSIEEKMDRVAVESTRVRVDGFERITKVETQLKQLRENDLVHLQKDVDSLKRTLSPRNLLFYTGGISALIVALTNIARVLKLLP
jgi:hypothetical protein